jgi:hypothetical protein
VGDRDVHASELGVELLHGFARRRRRRRHGGSHHDGSGRFIRSRAVRWINSWFTRVSGSYTSCGRDPPVIKGLDGTTASSRGFGRIL